LRKVLAAPTGAVAEGELILAAPIVLREPGREFAAAPVVRALRAPAVVEGVPAVAETAPAAPETPAAVPAPADPAEAAPAPLTVTKREAARMPAPKIPEGGNVFFILSLNHLLPRMPRQAFADSEVN
jgi:hypothetical protein